MASRSWAQERAKRKGGSNVRGSREPWERSKVKAHTRTLGSKKIRVKSFLRHKGKKKQTKYLNKSF